MTGWSLLEVAGELGTAVRIISGRLGLHNLARPTTCLPLPASARNAKLFAFKSVGLAFASYFRPPLSALVFFFPAGIDINDEDLCLFAFTEDPDVPLVEPDDGDFFAVVPTGGNR
jgi:hypothetical protein